MSFGTLATTFATTPLLTTLYLKKSSKVSCLRLFAWVQLRWTSTKTNIGSRCVLLVWTVRTSPYKFSASRSKCC